MTAPSPIPMRERLRTDYHWTARQRDVLALIARGRTNTQIGEALGISLDGAKWHVSEILSKLQAESREEAADYWRRYNGVAPRFERIFRGITGAVATKWVAGAAAVVVAGAATAVVVAIAINQSREDPHAGDSVSPDAAVAPAPDAQQPSAGTPNLAPDPSQPTNTTISITQPVKSIPNSVMYTVTGCFQCDGPDAGLQRHVADANGNLTSTIVLERQSGVLAGWEIGQYAASPDGSLLVGLACDGEYCGALGPAKPTATWRVVTSRDGGLSWNDWVRFPAEYAWIHDVGVRGLVVAVHAKGEPSAEFRLVSASDTKALVKPPGLDAGASPALRPNGEVLWVDAAIYGEFARLLREDGTPLALEGSTDDSIEFRSLDVLPDGTISVVVFERAINSFQTRFFTADGALLRKTQLGTALGAEFVSPALALSNMDGLALPQAEGGISYPVLIDLAKGTAQPIVADIFTQQRGRNRFVAFQTGPFATVNSGGDCLNVRESPSTSAKSLVCYRDGVLLRDLGETTDAGGATWLKVATVDGREGWASTEFLSR